MSDQLPQIGRDQQPPAPPVVSGWDHTHADGHPDRQHSGDSQTGHGGHRWLMIACCIPMLVIVGVLLATGIAGTGAVIYAVVCLGAMALMMFAMPGGHGR